MALHKKDEIAITPLNSCKPTKKDDISVPSARLPPRPQGLPLYKLPPKPSYHIPYSNNAVNRSSEVSQRDQSKENLRNLGARIVNEVKPVVVVVCEIVVSQSIRAVAKLHHLGLSVSEQYQRMLHYVPMMISDYLLM